MQVRLGDVGVWSGSFRVKDTALVAEAAVELEELGFGTLWFPGGLDRAFGVADLLLSATRDIAVATGIVNIWVDPAPESARQHARLRAAHSTRFLLGLGISHGPMVERLKPGAYRRPVETMAAYLDALDVADPPVPADERAIAALGPRMLDLARERSAGSHTYLVLPEQTAAARQRLGSGALLAAEQGVVLDADPSRARATARAALALYMELPNYVNNWLRAGFTADDVAAGGSDRLVDSLVAWGDDATVAARVRAHLDAGADHVCVQVLGSEPGELLPRAGWRRVAALLELQPAPEPDERPEHRQLEHQ